MHFVGRNVNLFVRINRTNNSASKRTELRSVNNQDAVCKNAFYKQLSSQNKNISMDKPY